MGHLSLWGPRPNSLPLPPGEATGCGASSACGLCGWEPNLLPALTKTHGSWTLSSTGHFLSQLG